MLSMVLFISGGEIFIILLFILIFFGADKIPEFTRMMGKGVREFRKATDDIKREFSENTSGVMNDIRSIQHDLTESLTKEIAEPVQETVSETEKTLETYASETEKTFETYASETKKTFEETEKTIEEYQDQYNRDFYYDYQNDVGIYGNEYRNETQASLPKSTVKSSDTPQTIVGNETESVSEIPKAKPKTRTAKPKTQTANDKSLNEIKPKTRTAKSSTKLNPKP